VQIADFLRQGPVTFVVVNCGQPLKWIAPEDCYRFWKDELKPHLVEPDRAEKGFRLEEFSGGFCFLASVWGAEKNEFVVVLETYH
jgi:hypothetical protein